MALNVVPFPQKIPLSDVVAQVRAFADQLEAGEYGDAGTVFCVVPKVDGYPSILGWGDVTGANDPIIQLELAKLWLLTNLTGGLT